jgi:hypothetical protein
MFKLRAVLADINQDVRDGQPHYFSINYVKTDGTLGAKQRVRKSGTTGARSGSTKFQYNLKEKGVLLLFNDLTDEHFSIRIDLITHYNGKEVRH